MKEIQQKKQKPKVMGSLKDIVLKAISVGAKVGTIH
jgi:hypothetical protein